MPDRYYVEKTRTRSGRRYLPMTDELCESLRTIVRNRPDLANAGMDVKNLQYLMGHSERVSKNGLKSKAFEGI